MTLGDVGLNPTRIVLRNGASIIVKETRRSPAVAISLAVRGGSSVESAAMPGVTHLLSRVMDRGTTTRSAADIAELLDGRGIALSCGASRHHLSLVCSSLAEDFETIFGLMAEVVRCPSIPDAELAIRKREVVTSLRQDEDNPAVRAVECLLTLLYGASHPYGRPVKGHVEAVEAMMRDDVLRLHAARVAPSELSVVVVGDVDHARVEACAARVLEEWHVPPPPAAPAPSVPSVPERRQVVIPMMNKAQAEIAYGFTSIRRDDPRYHAASLLNNVLGEYAMGGRLGESIRERQGMAYHVSSSLDAAPVEAPMLIRAGVSGANVERAIASIDQELSALQREGVGEHELADSRQYLIGSLPRALETNLGIAQFLQGVEFFGLGLDYDRRLPDLLRAVTRDEVHAVVSFLDPARATVVVAGPYGAA